MVMGIINFASGSSVEKKVVIINMKNPKYYMKNTNYTKKNGQRI